MKLLKPKFWQSKRLHILALLLWPISITIQILFFIRTKITKEVKLSVPVICVGNIYLGGTGKTPLTIKICSLINKLNRKTTIIKKFYKNHFDETEYIKEKNGHLFCEKSRLLASKKAIEKGFEVLVLDDGFQDNSIKKNINILCFNEKQLIGNGFTIPSGPLRESLESIKKCHIIIINGNANDEFENKIKLINNNLSIYYTKYIPKDIEKFKNKKYLAFAGIGNPDNFFDLLLENNLEIEKKLYFPDHYIYSQEDLTKIMNLAKGNNLEIITTEKDYFRFRNLDYNGIKHLIIKVQFSQEEKFIEEINKHL